MPDKSNTITAAAAGVAVIISVVALAYFLLTKDSPVAPIPLNIKCTADPDCPSKLACADCMECHTTLGYCVYKLKDAAYCKCVQGEVRPCDAGGIPGRQICESPDGSAADWGKCDKI